MLTAFYGMKFFIFVVVIFRHYTEKKTFRWVILKFYHKPFCKNSTEKSVFCSCYTYAYSVVTFPSLPVENFLEVENCHITEVWTVA